MKAENETASKARNQLSKSNIKGPKEKSKRPSTVTLTNNTSQKTGTDIQRQKRTKKGSGDNTSQTSRRKKGPRRALSAESSDLHQPRKDSAPDIKDENDAWRTTGLLKTEEQYSREPLTRKKNCNEDEEDTRERALDLFIRQPRGKHRTYFFVEQYECTSKHDTVEPLHYLSEHFISRYLSREQKTPISKNAWESQKQSRDAMLAH